MKYILFFILAIITINCVNSFKAEKSYPDCDGKVNDQPLINQEPILLSEITNGKKYVVKNLTNFVFIVKVKGSSSQMGKALGQLMKNEIISNANNMFKYLENQAVQYLIDHKVPKFIANYFGKTALQIAYGLLDLNWYIAKPYTPTRFDEELKGIADGANFDYLTLRRLNMFPELTKASCTIIGAWGKSTLNEQLLQVRALDWASDNPINQYPSITIYNPTEQGSFSFANIGYAGLVGSITAFSSNGIAISEKVWIPPKSDPAKWTYSGKPWMYVLRDLAQFSTNIQDAINTLFNTKRTVMIHIGLGSDKSNSFEGIEYSENSMRIFNDKNYTYTSAHPQMDGIMYWDKHVQPSGNACLGNILKDQYGQLTAENLFRQIGGLHKTGNTQLCVFDIKNHKIYLSYSEYKTNIDAYLRSPMLIDLKSLWEF